MDIHRRIDNRSKLDKKALGLLSAGHLITDVNQGAVPAMLPFLISAHSLSYAAAAGVVLATNLASTVVQPIFGHVADKVSRPWLLPLGLVMAGLGLGLVGFAPGYWVIIIMASISGIGIAAYHPEAARMVNFSAGSRKATAMSLFGVGGIMGFALGPILATAALLRWGLAGSLVLILPVGLMALLMLVKLPYLASIQPKKESGGAGAQVQTAKDNWGSFSRLTINVVCRSIIFYGLNTFIPLYWINVLGRSKAAGATALTVMAVSGVIGNLLGGPLSDRIGHRKTILVGFSLFIPLLPIMVYLKSPIMATLLLVPIGICLSATYSPMVILGQKYLPNHIGLSSGVTLGIAVAIGGVATPLLGWIADLHGIWWAVAGLTPLPVLALITTLTLQDRTV